MFPQLKKLLEHLLIPRRPVPVPIPVRAPRRKR